MIKKNTGAALKLIAFVEGGSVMACELFGAKLIAPYFGSSLYVWASVLSVTLGGLAAGYYSGGYLSKKYDNKKMLFGVLLMAGCFLFFMPFLAKFTLNRLIYFDIRTGSLLSLMVYMFPVLFFFGSSSPLIINILTEEKDDSGKNAGTIYAISTVGGIIYTLIIGFFILPEYGITKPAMFFGFFIICISVAFFIFRKDYFMLIIPLVFIAVSVYKYYKSESFADHRIIYKSEGILGQIKVVDSYYYSDESGWNPARYLLVNNIPQTIIKIENDKNLINTYPEFFPYLTTGFPPGSDVLLLGLGGGSAYSQFSQMGFNIDVVELDERIKNAAISYFGVNKNIRINTDDARHFIKCNNKKYDIIVYDVFISESPPAHALTQECFKEAEKNLNSGGIILVNFFGFINGKRGLASRSIYTTLVECGFSTKILATHKTSEEGRNLVFVAASKQAYYDTVPAEIADRFLNTEEIDFSDAKILTDDIPELERMYIYAAMNWKQNWNKFFRSTNFPI